jgi:uncharacterized Zn-binding protein involved in type VI secretion
MEPEVETQDSTGEVARSGLPSGGGDVSVSVHVVVTTAPHTRVADPVQSKQPEDVPATKDAPARGAN